MKKVNLFNKTFCKAIRRESPIFNLGTKTFSASPRIFGYAKKNITAIRRKIAQPAIFPNSAPLRSAELRLIAYVIGNRLSLYIFKLERNMNNMSIKNFLRPTKKRILLTIIIFIIFHLTINFIPIFYLVQSNSMSPTINRGDYIFISPVNFNDIKVGDIVVTKYPAFNSPLVHRVIHVDREKKHI